MTTHEVFMCRAMAVAKANPRHPFGAVIVDVSDQQVIAEGVNRSHLNPVLHGEIDAINRCAESRPAAFAKLTLYSTAEPCPMCMAAILWCGLGTVVFGTSIPTLMSFGWKQIDIRACEVIDRSHRKDCQLVPGVLQNECDAMFQSAASATDLG